MGHSVSFDAFTNLIWLFWTLFNDDYSTKQNIKYGRPRVKSENDDCIICFSIIQVNNMDQLSLGTLSYNLAKHVKST